MVAGAAADFVEQVAGAAVDVFALQEVLVGAQLAFGAAFAPQGIAATVRVGLAHRLALLAGLLLTLLFGHGLAKIAHAFAQRFHRLRLIVDRPGEVVILQVALGTVHRIARVVEGAAGGLSRFRPGPGEVLALAIEFLPQLVLPLGEAFGAGCAGLGAIALSRLARLARLPRLAGLLALSRLVLALLALTLSGLLARLLPRLLTLLPRLLPRLAGIELFL